MVAALCAVALVLGATAAIVASASTGRPGTGGGGEEATAKARAHDALGQLPLSFESNRGQIQPDVDFVARGSRYSMSFAPNEAVVSLKAFPVGEAPSPSRSVKGDWTSLRMQVVGANVDATPMSEGALPGKVNNFGGNDPSRWVTDIATYSKVGYRGVYQGVDLWYYGRQGALEYDFVVDPGADPRAITLRFADVESMAIDAGGDLVLKTKAGELRQTKPYLYQEVGGQRQRVEGGFVLRGDGHVGFDVGAYDGSRKLVIDPVLEYSTYLGGRSTDFGFGIAVDKAGNIYLGGQSTTAGGTTPQFPGRAPIGGSTLGSDDAYVAKLAPNADGSYALAYASFVGGPLSEAGWDVGVDSAGNTYLGGSTNSADDPGTPNVTEPGFPTTANALDSTCGSDGYCNRLPAGWFAEDDPNTADVNEAGPCPPSLFADGCATPPSSLGDNFLVKFNSAGNSLLYSTFLGGGDAEVAGETIPYAAPMGVAVSGTKAVMHSWTGSSDFPTKNAYQSACDSCGVGNPDGYLTVIDTSKSGQSSLAYSTYIGGSGIEDGKDVALDKAGFAYVVGTTVADYSLEDPNSFPTTENAYQPNYRGGNSDAYVAKFNTSASGQSSLLFSTFLGGGGTDEGWDIVVEDGTAKNGGKAYVTGYTTSGPNPRPENENPLDPAPDPAPYFPTTKGAYDTHYEGRATTASGSTLFLDGDAFVVKFKGDGRSLAYSTFIGGPNADYGNGIVVDSKGQAYVTGWTTCRMQDNRATAVNEAPPRFTPFDDDDDPATDPVMVPTGRNPGEPAETGVGDCDAPGQAGAFPQLNPIPGEEVMETAYMGFELHNSPTGIFVTKLLPGGVGAAYSVLIDGPGFDRGFAIAVRDKNAQGRLLGYTDPVTGTFVPQPEAYVTGRAQVDYPVTPNAIQTTYNGNQTPKPAPGNGRDAPVSKVVG